jgi:hypothetical protein
MERLVQYTLMCGGRKIAAAPASPRGILHLTLLGARISMHKTNLVARLCEGGTTEANNIRGTALRGSTATAANLNNIALR